MITVISPAKRLDWQDRDTATQPPRMQDQADILAGHARQLSVADLKSLMGLSDDLAKLNRDRFQAMKTAGPDAARPAIHAFAGDTYQGLAAQDLDEDALRWAETHLRILSGLYGVLRPHDAIHAYRLEMGTRLKTRRGDRLTDFWGDRIALALKADAEAADTDVLVNCASNEYFAAADRQALSLRIVTPKFLDDTGKGPKVVGLFAKRARGAMARYMVENRLQDPADLEAFDYLGYTHSPDLSEQDAPAFLR